MGMRHDVLQGKRKGQMQELGRGWGMGAREAPAGEGAAHGRAPVCRGLGHELHGKEHAQRALQRREALLQRAPIRRHQLRLYHLSAPPRTTPAQPRN
jgi:hypothetical protein